MSDRRSAELARAAVLVELKRWDEAVAVLGGVVASDPSQARPHCLLAQALLGAGRPADALEQAGQAAAADPENEWAHRLRSIALLRLGEAAMAVAAAREAVRLAPGLDSPYLVAVDAELGRRNTKAAAAAAAKATELAPNRSASHDALGRVALARRRNRRAEGHFRDALRVDPENPAALNNLGLALLRQGRRRAAVAYFASASKANPHSDLPRRNAVRATVGAGGAVVAIVATQAVVRTSGGSSVGWVVASVAILVAVAVGCVRQSRNARRHDDPLASKELMRSLRRQAGVVGRFFPGRFFHRRFVPGRFWPGLDVGLRLMPVPAIPLLAAFGLFVTVGGAISLARPDPYDPVPPAVCWFFLVAGVSFVGLAIATVAARRRASRREG